MRKWFVVILVVILVGGGGTYWYHEKKAKAKEAQANVIIPTATVQRGTLESDVTGSGDLTPHVDEDVTADSSQTIYAIKVSAGQTVKEGQEILEYDNGTYADAPAAGTVTAINVYDASNVHAGSVLYHLTSYQNLDTVVSVDELDIPNVKVGQPVNVTVNAYPNKNFTGKVSSIADSGTDTNGVSTFGVTVHLNDSTNLKPGMTTSASIVTNKKTNTLYVPISAIHKQGNTTYVLVDSGSTSSSQFSQNSAQNSYRRQNGNGQGQGYGQGYGRRQWAMGGASGNAHMVTVKTGINNDNYIQILSGLSAGQVVQLPPIVSSSTTSSSSSGSGFGMYGGMGMGMGMRMGGQGGYSRSFSGGGSYSKGSGSGTSNSGGNTGGGN